MYWFTLGGFGIWTLIDLFTMSGKVNNFNAEIFRQIEVIEKKENDDQHAKNIAMIAAANGNKK